MISQWRVNEWMIDELWMMTNDDCMISEWTNGLTNGINECMSEWTLNEWMISEWSPNNNNTEFGGRECMNDLFDYSTTSRPTLSEYILACIQVVCKNRNEREAERSSEPDIDSHMLWLLMQHLRRSRRRQVWRESPLHHCLSVCLSLCLFVYTSA